MITVTPVQGSYRDNRYSRLEYRARFGATKSRVAGVPCHGTLDFVDLVEVEVVVAKLLALQGLRAGIDLHWKRTHGP